MHTKSIPRLTARMLLSALAVTALFLSVTPNPRAAETASTAAETQQTEVRKLMEQLKLTDEQKAAVEPILRESFAKQREVLQRHQGQKGQKGLRALLSLRRELEPIRKETDGKLKGILSAEQMKQFQKLREELRKETRKRLREKKK